MLIGRGGRSVRKQYSTGETATLVQSASRGKSSRAWMGAALLLILIAGGAAGFYAYRVRKQAQPNSSPTTASPPQSESNQPAQSPPANGSQVDSTQVDSTKTIESKTEKKVDTSQRTAAAKQSLNKTEAKTS